MAILRLLLLPIKILGRLLKKSLKRISLYFLKLTWKSYLKFLGAIISALITSWGFYTYYNPDISVVASDPLKSDNIFTSRFIIENHGNCNIYNVKVGYILKDIHFDFGGNTARSGNITYESATIYRTIKESKKQTIDINLIQGGFYIFDQSHNPITSYNANLTWVIQYDYWFHKKTKNDTLHFYTSDLIDGKITWYSNQ